MRAKGRTALERKTHPGLEERGGLFFTRHIFPNLSVQAPCIPMPGPEAFLIVMAIDFPIIIF
jgi:hypothetical protein